MKQQKSELYFLFVLLLGIFVMIFFIFKPFLYALILAIVFAIVFGPIHKKVFSITRGKKGLSAIIATASVLIVVIVPLSFLSVQIFQETTHLYSSLVGNSGATNISLRVNDVLKNLTKFSPVPIELSIDVNQYLRLGLGWLIQNLGPLFANATKAVVSIFIFLIALYYLFKDGYKLKSTIIALSPLQDVHDETIFNKLVLAINSVVRGSLFIAIIQGLLTAVGFSIFGVPNPTLWGIVAVIAALVPSIGTALVIFPAIIYLYFSGEVISAVGLFVWGVTAVGLIDNFLVPKFIEKRILIHPFLILLSILGGIGFFGPIGFLLGPLSLSMLFVLLEIYSTISKKYTSQ